MEKIQVLDKTFRLYMPETEIQATVKRLADELSRDYKGKDPILCPVLTGSYLFVADLTRQMDFDAQVSLVRYTSYEGR
jgi:hypoxanthine-guanine phosphoribosyltransferase